VFAVPEREGRIANLLQVASIKSKPHLQAASVNLLITLLAMTEDKQNNST